MDKSIVLLFVCCVVWHLVSFVFVLLVCFNVLCLFGRPCVCLVYAFDTLELVAKLRNYYIHVLNIVNTL